MDQASSTTLNAAKCDARRFSRKYLTFWYVREVKPGVFQAYAHDSDDERTVATFYCGKPYTK